MRSAILVEPSRDLLELVQVAFDQALVRIATMGGKPFVFALADVQNNRMEREFHLEIDVDAADDAAQHWISDLNPSPQRGCFVTVRMFGLEDLPEGFSEPHLAIRVVAYEGDADVGSLCFVLAVNPDGAPLGDVALIQTFAPLW